MQIPVDIHSSQYLAIWSKTAQVMFIPDYAKHLILMSIFQDDGSVEHCVTLPPNVHEIHVI